MNSNNRKESSQSNNKNIKKGTSTPEYKLAEILIKEHHIINIEKCFYYYNNGYYNVLETANDIKALIYTKWKAIKKSKRNEIYEDIILDLNILRKQDKNYICFNNGLLRLSDYKLVPHTPDIICTTKIPHNYVPLQILFDNYDEKKYHFLIKCLSTWTDYNLEVQTLLLEMIGYCLTFDTKMQKGFILVGDKKNGKSTFIDLLEFILHLSNITSLDISQLSEKFNTATMNNKLANICDDISSQFIKSDKNSTFKKIITGNSIKAEYKNGAVFSFKPYAKMIFSANEPPKSMDLTGALNRRLIMIPFNHTITEKENDPNILDKLLTEDIAEYAISLAIEAYKKVLERKQFTTCESTDQLSKLYQMQSNSVVEWFEESNVINIIPNKSPNELYKEYKTFCNECNYYILKRSDFYKTIENKYGLIRKTIHVNNNQKTSGIRFVPIKETTVNLQEKIDIS